MPRHYQVMKAFEKIIDLMPRHYQVMKAFEEMIDLILNTIARKPSYDRDSRRTYNHN